MEGSAGGGRYNNTNTGSGCTYVEGQFIRWWPWTCPWFNTPSLFAFLFPFRVDWINSRADVIFSSLILIPHSSQSTYPRITPSIFQSKQHPRTLNPIESIQEWRRVSGIIVTDWLVNQNQTQPPPANINNGDYKDDTHYMAEGWGGKEVKSPSRAVKEKIGWKVSLFGIEMRTQIFAQ